jgi:hypothetical protein
MSKIALTPNASGTGVFTISSPATNTNRTLTLPDEAGSIVVNTATGIDVTGTVSVNAGASGTTASAGYNELVIEGGNEDIGMVFLSPAANNKTQTIAFGDSNNNSIGEISYEHANDAMTFDTNGAQRMQIDSSGNLLVGTTSNNIYGGTTTGINLNPDGATSFNRASGQAAMFNRISTDGDIVQFRKDGTTVGSIGVTGGVAIYTVLRSGAGGMGITASGDRLVPTDGSGATTDGVSDLGKVTIRWNDVYAINGTIQTSDRNEKQDIEALSDAEKRVAVACKGLLRKFRWIDAVAKKGDDARIHFGIIAQDLQDAFAAEGLDAGRYAMFISSTWWETDRVVPAVEAVEGAEATYDDEGNQLTKAVEAVVSVSEHTVTDHYDTLEEAPEGATERTRLGVRYPELLAFIIGAL